MRKLVTREGVRAAVFAFQCMSLSVFWLAAQDRVVTDMAQPGQPAKQTVEQRIAAVEKGLTISPVRISGEVAEKRLLEQSMKAGNVPGMSVAVVDGYKVAWAKGYGVVDTRSGTPVTPETLFSAGSITKAVTAATVLKLADEGKIDIDRDVNTLLKHWKVPTNKFTEMHAVTLRFLLSHSSGIGDHFPRSYPAGAKMPTTLERLSGGADGASGPVVVEHEPGTNFDYSSGAYLIVEQAVADALDKPFPEIVEEEVFKTVGMNHSTFIQPKDDHPSPDRATGHIRTKAGGVEAKAIAFPELASSGLWTTPVDLAKLLIKLQLSDRGSGLLSERRYNEMLRPVVNNACMGFFLTGTDQGLKMRIRGTDGTPQDEYNAWAVAYAHDGKAAVVMTNSSNLSIGFAMLRSIAQEYNWNDYIPTRTARDVDPGIYQKYIGDFVLEDAPLTIAAEGNGLYATLNGWKLRLLAQTETTYFVNNDLLHELTVQFLVKTDGSVETILFHYPFRSYKAIRVRRDTAAR
jgi:CubicO group peptidase (beta-lactamase class C family)